MKEKVIVGMSGGVDSSVAAYLLIEQGYSVEGLFMKNWEDDDTEEYCSSAADLADAQCIATLLGIKLHVINFSKKYWDHVFSHFLNEYRAGRTPNPDILCNKEIKFKAFLDHALNLGADFIATGHYVQRNDNQLLRGFDKNKDQSYFLYAISDTALRKSLFPIGHLSKQTVRDIAKKNDFINHAKKDSTGICFIGERRFRDFLKSYLLSQPGPIMTDEGDIIGQHDGLMYHTIGQRSGLNIGGLPGKAEKPWYVARKDIDKNALIVVQGQDHPGLFSDTMHCTDLHVFNEAQLPLHCTVKIRYRQPDVPCDIKVEDDQLRIHFETAQAAVTPGQAAVFYQGEICLGGATIT